MNGDIKSYVINLLETCQVRKRKIALLHYELEHPARTSEAEMISAMALGHGAGNSGGHTEGHISDKTLYIALNYQSKVDKLNADIIGSFYSVAELERLFQAVKGDPVEFPVLMAAFYGLRRSEIMGLRWQAIDFVGNTIIIDHTVVQFRSKGKTKVIQKDRTKNASSCRSLPYC